MPGSPRARVAPHPSDVSDVYLAACSGTLIVVTAAAVSTAALVRATTALGATVAVIGCGSQGVAQRSLLLEALLLATDGAHFALHEVAVLEDALILEGSRGEFLTLAPVRSCPSADRPHWG